MKIIIINGSPRKKGATAKILHGIEAQLSAKPDTDIEYIDISALSVKPCTGCMSCYKTGKCFIDDEAEALSLRIAEADGLIIGSPTYASNISGQLKQFIDRGHFVIEQLLYGKYAVSVVTGVNYGNRDAAKILGDLLRFSGALMSGSIVCNVPFNTNPCDDKMNTRIKNTAERLYEDIAGKRKHPLQSAFHGMIFSAGIRPFVKKQGEAYRGVTEKWSRMGIKV